MQEKPYWVVNKDRSWAINRLAFYEKELQRCIDAMGTTLKAIRDERLYEAEEYASFEEYCQKKLGIGRSRASQLISAETVRLALMDSSDDPDTRNVVEKMNERQLRVMARVEPEMRLEIVNEAKVTGDTSASKLEALAAKTGAIPASKIRQPKLKHICPECGHTF